MGLNLHDLVRGPIQAVNPDVAGTVYVSTGTALTRGISVPTFSTVAAMLQVQAAPHSPVLHERGVLYVENKETIYAYGNFSDLERPDQVGGALVQVTATSQWFAVTQVIEWWPGWCQLEVTRQLNAANITALLAQIQNGTNPP
jgi:hypothetical protein